MRIDFPRLKAIALCGLLIALLGFVYFAARDTGPRIAPQDLSLSDVAADPGLPGLVAEEPAFMHEPPAEPAARGPIAVAIPRIAYIYGYTFRLAAGDVAAVQERHLGLCRRLGAARCRVVSMRRGGQAEGQPTAELELAVAAPLADAFGRRLVSTAAGATTVDRAIAAEDLTRQMIDSDARIRTRETLIRRLTGLLETRSGNIQQAVEAERAINNAQEELEAARALLEEMRARVAMSTVEIRYQAEATPAAPAGNPAADAFAQLGRLAAASLGVLILVAGIALPWLLAGALVFVVMRVLRRRRDPILEEG